ncbi:MAG TPA: hypothetical protein VIS96_07060 [Terrimicrobiaceae bacterium]
MSIENDGSSGKNNLSISQAAMRLEVQTSGSPSLHTLALGLSQLRDSNP